MLTVHSAQAVAAVVLEKFPAVHFKHVPDPKWPLTVPTGHAVQLPPSGPSYPALHLHPLQPCAECAFCGHAWHVVAAVELEYSPAEQSTHADDPLAALNVPTGHAEQALPSAPVYPCANHIRFDLHSLVTMLLIHRTR